MIPQQFFYLMVVLGFLWIFFMLHVTWPSQCPATPRRPVEPILPPHKRSNEPQSFAGLIHKPLCDACEHAAEARPQAPAPPPPLITFTRGRQRTIDTQQLTAGQAGATSVPTVTLGANRGGSSSVCPATAMSRKPTAPSCM